MLRTQQRSRTRRPGEKEPASRAKAEGMTEEKNVPVSSPVESRRPEK